MISVQTKYNEEMKRGRNITFDKLACAKNHVRGNVHELVLECKPELLLESSRKFLEIAKLVCLTLFDV